MAGGQLLRGAADVYISGQGVRARVIRYVKPIGNLRSEQRQLLQQHLRQARDKRLRESGITPPRLPKRETYKNLNYKKLSENIQCAVMDLTINNFNEIPYC